MQPISRPWRGSRGRLFGLGGLGVLWLATRGRAQAASRGLLSGLSVANEGVPYAGDGPGFLLESAERDDGTTLVKLVDFGIAKIVRDAHDARFARKGITRRGTAIGTHHRVCRLN